MDLPDVGDSLVESFDLETYGNEQDIHYAGDVVKGSLRMILLKELDAGSYTLDIFIEGKLVIIESDILTTENKFLTIRPQLAGGEGDHADDNGLTSDALEAGEHIVEFGVILLPKLPSSVATSWLQVVYTMEARLVSKQSSGVLASTSRPLLVHDVLDLNSDPEAGEGEVVRSVQERSTLSNILGCLTCWLQGLPPAAVCSIPKRGFIPFSIITLRVNLSNANPCMPATTSIEVFLVQEVRWKTTFFKSFMIEGSKVEGDDLLDPEFTQFGYSLRVPNAPPTGTYPEIEVTIGYKVCIVVRLGGRIRPIRLTLPIIIGTTALMQDLDLDVTY